MGLIEVSRDDVNSISQQKAQKVCQGSSARFSLLGMIIVKVKTANSPQILPSTVKGDQVIIKGTNVRNKIPQGLHVVIRGVL